MNNEENLKMYGELNDAQENKQIQIIEFHHKDGSKSVIEDEELIKTLLNSALICLESQRYKSAMEKFGNYPENIKHTKEYKLANEIESYINCSNFNNKLFANSILFMHRTNQQSLFRLFKETILYYAGLEIRHIDGRNRAAYELSQKISKILQETGLPFI